MRQSNGTIKNDWQTVWSKKSPEENGSDLLSSLIKADGFDSGFSFYTPADWLLMVEDAAERANVSRESQVLEIGCGSGAFLYALHQLRGCSISGLDYSPALVDAAMKHLPQGAFAKAEATNIPFETTTFDCIFSHGVFFYFPDLAYAETVLREACRKLKPGGFLCLMDMNDRAHEAAYLEERRKMFTNPEEYELKYRGLSHLFFDKDELADSLHKAGFEAIHFFNHRVPTYEPARFRFNLIAAKGHLG
jgi:ubiquinone/menaquinone biosynthesis C-methylase UbiE